MTHHNEDSMEPKPPMENEVDEDCLALARIALSDERWTERDRIHLAHMLERTVFDYMDEVQHERR